MDSGATISAEVALTASTSIISRMYSYYQAWNTLAPEMFRQRYIGSVDIRCIWDRTEDNPRALLEEYWFPLQLPHDRGHYIGPDDNSIQRLSDRWTYARTHDDENFSHPYFYSGVSSVGSIPPLGEWFRNPRYPHASIDGNPMCVVGSIDIPYWLNALDADKRKLLCAAEKVARGRDVVAPHFFESLHGWEFQGESQHEKVQEVLQWHPLGWERGVGLFSRTGSHSSSGYLKAFLEETGIFSRGRREWFLIDETKRPDTMEDSSSMEYGCSSSSSGTSSL